MSARRRIVVAVVALVAAAGVVWAVVMSGPGAGPVSGPDPAGTTQPASSGTAPPPASAPASTPPTAPPTASPTAPAPATTAPTTAVPEPSPGTPTALGSGATVSVAPARTKEPVDLDDTADFDNGLTVRITGTAAVKGQASVPGEISAPAIKITVVARNTGRTAADLSRTVVFTSYGRDRTPASSYSKGSRPLGGSLAAGKSSTGTYVVAVPLAERRDVRVEISTSGETPTVAFEGAVPK